MPEPKSEKNLLMVGMASGPSTDREKSVTTWFEPGGFNMKGSFRIGLQHAGTFQEYGDPSDIFFVWKSRFKVLFNFEPRPIKFTECLEKEPRFLYGRDDTSRMTHLAAFFFFSSCGRRGEPYLEHLRHYASHDANGNKDVSEQPTRVTLRALMIFLAVFY